MRFDLIISNPPYGKVGNEITKNIICSIEWDTFINLMPANDWRRYNRDFKLYQFVDLNTIRPIMKGFKDAAVTTMLCKVMKERQCSRTQSEFEIENYIDESLKKYFYENVRREHYAIDTTYFRPFFDEFETTSIEKSFYIGHRDISHGHLPYSLNSLCTRYNMNKVTKEQVINDSAKSVQAKGMTGDFYLICFDTENEKTNFSNFIYSKDGFRFISKVFTALNIDSSIPLGKVFPKVDWEKPQTVESILLDYNYTPAEIAEILDDLKNYKYMDEVK